MSTFYDYGQPTVTSKEQQRIENLVVPLLKNNLELHVDNHIQYLMKSLSHLSSNFQCLDASHPWLCYWILHSLDLLNVKLPESRKDEISDYLGRCQSEDGGFCGGPGQLPHLATTYAAVNALTILGQSHLDRVVNKAGLQKFIERMHDEKSGEVRMHDGGEVDVRGPYLALSAASLTGIISENLLKNVELFIRRCQTYEGGITGYPGSEAHGGYTFCGLAALALIGKIDALNVSQLVHWLSARQMKAEGGFNGRTNKLVDGCYSFWQAGAFHILNEYSSNLALPINYDSSALEKYILNCSQNPAGGFMDKPCGRVDLYHTCYCLSGLALCNSKNVGKTHPLFNITNRNISNFAMVSID